jgi:hypothetical protein
MAEVLATFPDPLVADNGQRYTAQACGGQRDDGLWEAWIEFLPVGSGTPVRSSRETTQPNRTDATYWAGGLSTVYLEGALQRALHPLVVEKARPAEALFHEPARGVTVTNAGRAQQAVLDPFSVYEKGEMLLRQGLGALSAWHLVNIITAYGLSDEPETMLDRLPEEALVDLIVAEVRQKSRVR